MILIIQFLFLSIQSTDEQERRRIFRQQLLADIKKAGYSASANLGSALDEAVKAIQQVSPSINLFSSFIYPSSSSVDPPMYTSSVALSITPFFHPSVSTLTTQLSIHPSINSFNTHLFIHSSIYSSINPSIHSFMNRIIISFVVEIILVSALLCQIPHHLTPPLVSVTKQRLITVHIMYQEQNSIMRLHL